MRIGFCGDVFLPRPIALAEFVGPDLRRLIMSCTSVFANFEGPIETDGCRRAFKTGPNLSQWNGGLSLLRQAGFGGISLANNHAADFGADALRATMRVAERAGLDVVGVESSDMIAPVIVENDGLRVAILAFAEQEWSGKERDCWRVSLFDVVQATRAINRAKGVADAVLVCLHGNNEHASLPNPAFAERVRFLVEQGADAVLVHHAHAISGIEMHCKRPIFWGLGNFFFPNGSKSTRWREGLFAVLIVTRGPDGIDVTIEPHAIATEGAGKPVDLANSDRRILIENEIAARSEIIASRGALREHFDYFVEINRRQYEEFFNPYWNRGLLGRQIGRALVKFVVLWKQNFAMQLNMMRCDAHRSVMTRLLERRLPDDP